MNPRNGDGGIKLLYDLETTDVRNAGWHCSSCFATTDQFPNKVSSFFHMWVNHASYRNRTRIAEHVRNGKDLWQHDGEVHNCVENNRDVRRWSWRGKGSFSILSAEMGRVLGFRLSVRMEFGAFGD